MLAQLRMFHEIPHHVLPPPDLVGEHERLKNPAPQKSPPHRRHREVEHIEKCATLLPSPQRLDQLEIPTRHFIEQHDTSWTAKTRRLQVGHATGPDFFQVVHQCACGSNERLIAGLEPKPVQRLQPVDAQELISRHVSLEHPVIADGARHHRSGGIELLCLLERTRQQQFGWLDPTQLSPQLVCGHDLRGELAGRNIERRKRKDVCRRLEQRHEEIVLARSEQIVREHSARRHSFCDLALHDARRQRRVLDLVADRYSATESDQLRQVVVERLDRYSSQRDLSRRAIISERERESQEARALLRIAVEELIEVPHADEQ